MNDPKIEVSPPCIAIVWDPELVTHEQYAELVSIIGDAARAAGALGIQHVGETLTMRLPQRGPDAG